MIDLNLIQDEIPRDLSLLIVVGPKGPFKPDELAKLKAFATAGGPVMLASGQHRAIGARRVLEVVQPGDRQRARDRSAVQLQPEPGSRFRADRVGGEAPDRRSTGGDAGRAHAGRRADSSAGSGERRAVRRPSRLIPAWSRRRSCGRPKYAWAESDPKNPPLRLIPRAATSPGPLIVGVAVSQRPEKARPGEPAEGKPRLVLLSSPAMAENVYQEIEQTNLDLLMNAASWLRNRPDTQGIPPHTHVALTLSVDPFLRSRLILVPSAVAAMLIIAMGITVYMARRQ